MSQSTIETVIHYSWVCTLTSSVFFVSWPEKTGRQLPYDMVYISTGTGNNLSIKSQNMLMAKETWQFSSYTYPMTTEYWHSLNALSCKTCNGTNIYYSTHLSLFESTDQSLTLRRTRRYPGNQWVLGLVCLVPARDWRLVLMTLSWLHPGYDHLQFQAHLT